MIKGQNMNNRFNFSHLADLHFSDSENCTDNLQLTPAVESIHGDQQSQAAKKLSPYFFDQIIKKYTEE